MEVGSSGRPDKNQVYRLSNTTADNLRTTRSVSTVGSVITQFWVIPKKINFFFKIKNNNNKGWQRGESKPGNQAAILEEIQGLVVSH
jgi:hypothetical protein